MSLHSEVAWFSGWTNRFPNYPHLSLVSRVNNIAFVERATRKLGKWPRAGETYKIWNSCFLGFSSADYEWGTEQLDTIGADKLRWLIRSHLKWQGKRRFLTKYTGWPRIRFLRSIFPDAHFVYIDRDPRAVVFSYLKQNWWKKDLEGRSLEYRLEFYSKRYLDYHRAKNQYARGRDYIQAYYERLIEEPKANLRGILHKCSLNWSLKLATQVESWRMDKSKNRFWRSELIQNNQTLITSLLEQPLTDMDYIK
jgi:hypothetical protein